MTAPAVRYESMYQDSTRWELIDLREDDIVISTPPKCGTTWTQIICGLLIFGRPELPARLDDLSIWPDVFLRTPESVVATLEAQRHRRFLKTHTPIDGIPNDPRVSYIGVGRDPRDAGISWDHHMANMDFETIMRIRAEHLGAEQAEMDMPEPAPTLAGRFRQWVDSDDPTVSLQAMIHHITLLWERRDDPNVLLLHFDDLRGDLDGQMRRIADFLGIAVDEEIWPELVRAATFDEVRNTEAMIPEQGIWKDDQSFFRKGTTGEWRELFDDADLAHYRSRVTQLATPEVAAWLHRTPL